MKHKYHKLTIVATPIGNLQEITQRAINALTQATTIICEDTRVTKKLLTLLKIDQKQKLISYNKMTEQNKLEKILRHLEDEECVLVSDAGYPIISDPGFLVVQHLRNNNSQVEVINGPCAMIHAIVGSGVNCSKFIFANFLTKKTLQRKKELMELKKISVFASIVYYEPSSFLFNGLKLLQDIFGDIKIVIAKELSKIYEDFVFDYISELSKNINKKGEFVIIIPMQKEVYLTNDLNIILKKINDNIKEGFSLKEACKMLSNSNYSASDLYKEYLNRKKLKN